MRLIDADALIDAIEHSRGKNSIYAQFVRAWVKESPTVDAVSVVRCKDCRWWDDCDELNENGYCHHGERKDDE